MSSSSNPSMMPCAAPHWLGWVAMAAVGRMVASWPMTSQKLCRHYRAWATQLLWALEPQACDWFYTDTALQLTRDALYCQNELSDCSLPTYETFFLYKQKDPKCSQKKKIQRKICCAIWCWGDIFLVVFI